MKIGFANLFSFRPHVEHLYYLSSLIRQNGHEVLFLTCDGGVKNCYPRALKGTSKSSECPRCILGGIRSYPVRSVFTVSAGAVGLDETVLDSLALSSSCTLNRTESDSDWNTPEVIATRRSLYGSIDSVYQSALKWIDGNRLDAVICFNGRMDLTRAVTYACEQSGIPYITHERTWFGNGLHLVPNANCLSIAAIDKMVMEFESKPLRMGQAKLAAKLVSDRFLQRNSLEWRVYNKSPEPTKWPLSSAGPRVLVLPSSRNEFAGHDDWKSGWRDNTSALDDLFDAFSIKREQVVVRCHPNWAEKIGKATGVRSLNLYREWSKKRGIHCISSEQRCNTYDLIQQADIVIMNGGSAAVEAGVCGKQIICLGPVNYQNAGFVHIFRDREALYRSGGFAPIDPNEIIRKTLRFLYLNARRFPQYVDYVNAISTTKYCYYEGANPERILSMIKTGNVQPDDPTHAVDTTDEDHIIQAMKDRDWDDLARYEFSRLELTPLNIERRKGLRWIDDFRAKLKKGDEG